MPERFTSFAELSTIKDRLPKHAEQSPPIEPLPETTSLSIERFWKENAAYACIEPNLSYLEGKDGISSRMSAVMQEHLGSTLPVVHFTNAEVGESIKGLVSTGFLERFMNEGTNGKLHVGAFRTQDDADTFQDMKIEDVSPINILRTARKIALQFYKHGKRTNKNSLKENRDAPYSLPAVILLPRPAKLERGTDEYYHWIIPQKVYPDNILSIFALSPDKATRYEKISHKKQREIAREILRHIGLQRLEQLHASDTKVESEEQKTNIIIYAHDLVDGFLISEKDFQSTFPQEMLNPYIERELTRRRQKYALTNKMSSRSA